MVRAHRVAEQRPRRRDQRRVHLSPAEDRDSSDRRPSALGDALRELRVDDLVGEDPRRRNTDPDGAAHDRRDRDPDEQRRAIAATRRPGPRGHIRIQRRLPRPTGHGASSAASGPFAVRALDRQLRSSDRVFTRAPPALPCVAFGARTARRRSRHAPTTTTLPSPRARTRARVRCGSRPTPAPARRGDGSRRGPRRPSASARSPRRARSRSRRTTPARAAAT